MMLPAKISHTIDHAIMQLEAAKRNFAYDTFDVDCALLPPPVRIKGQNEPEGLNRLIDWAKRPVKSRPCVYRIEWLGSTAVETVRNTYVAYREKKLRNSAAHHKHPNTTSQTLYVGKVKKDICGRIMVHLGYYHNSQTAGLQLIDWAPALGLHIRFHIWSFEPAMAHYVGLFEAPVAQEYKPLIGRKH